MEVYHIMIILKFSDKCLPSALAFKNTCMTEKREVLCLNHDYFTGLCRLIRYCLDRYPLSRYCLDMCPLSRNNVDICPHSSYRADRFCWFLAVSLFNYPDMYGLIYQLNGQNNLSHIFSFT